MTNRRRYSLEAAFGRILSPFEQFLRRTTSGGIVLVATTLLALALASGLGAEAYDRFWDRHLAIVLEGRPPLDLSMRHWINDALMTLFFLVVGLELKREILVGELASLKDAALPIFAAIGGMVVPALIYLAFNAGTPTASGWGIAMATDIAFAVGILVLLAWRIPKNLIIFLTALAIADDLGAVLVIALFYTSELNHSALVSAAMLCALLVLFNRAGVRRTLPYAVVGFVLWLCLLASGIHATVAGILLAFAIPAKPAHTPAHFDTRIAELHSAFRDERDADGESGPLSNHRMATIAHAMEHSARSVQSPLERLLERMAPWVTFVVIPVFALANAGIDLGEIRWSDALSSHLIVGILLGLLLGKFAGISLFSWVAVRLGWARLPSGVSWKHLLGAAWLAGIGFTMSLFIAQLAFDDPVAIAEAKLGILLASALSAGVGLTWLFLSAAPRKA